MTTYKLKCGTVVVLDKIQMLRKKNFPESTYKDGQFAISITLNHDTWQFQYNTEQARNKEFDNLVNSINGGNLSPC